VAYTFLANGYLKAKSNNQFNKIKRNKKEVLSKSVSFCESTS
jgi:hypothetical protein